MRMALIALTMSFAQPAYLWLLLLVGPLVAWVSVRRRTRAARWRALGQESRLPPDRIVGWVVAMGCLIVALAEPRWGRVAGPPLPPGHDVVLLIDVSRSMGARDAVPNRLGLAAETAASLVRALGREPGSRAAVVVFAGRGRERCPLTTNLGAVVDVLHSLRPGEVQPGGTDLGAALRVASEAFDQAEHAEGRTIVVFSDGEDHVQTWPEAAAELRASGVLVHAVAIGDDTQGESVPSGQGTTPLRYRGEPVVSRRTDGPLEGIAQATGGAFLKLGLSAADLGPLYLTKIAPLARRERKALQPPEQAERYSWLVLAAFFLCVRASWPRGRFAGAGRWALLASLLFQVGAGAPGTEFRRALAEGHAAFADGRFTDALHAFERAATLERRSAVATFDAAAVLFRLERYADAYARYNAARELADPALKAKIDYALGNTALALGDVGAAVRHYEACLTASVTGPAVEAVKEDAAINRRYAEALPRPPQPQPERDPSQSPDSQGAQGKGKRDHAPGESSASSDTEPPADGEGQSPRTGNAGGAGNASGRTAQEQLDDALSQIRAETDRRRIPDEPPATADVDRKDW